MNTMSPITLATAPAPTVCTPHATSHGAKALPWVEYSTPKSLKLQTEIPPCTDSIGPELFTFL